MLAAAYAGTFAEAVGAVLPCAWIYLEVGKVLSRTGSPNPLYQRWIDMYGGEEYEQLVRAVIDIADELGPSLGERERELVKERFVVASRYEWMFWDMGLRRRSGPSERLGGYAVSVAVRRTDSRSGTSIRSSTSRKQRFASRSTSSSSMVVNCRSR